MKPELGTVTQRDYAPISTVAHSLELGQFVRIRHMEEIPCRVYEKVIVTEVTQLCSTGVR